MFVGGHPSCRSCPWSEQEPRQRLLVVMRMGLIAWPLCIVGGTCLVEVKALQIIQGTWSRKICCHLQNPLFKAPDPLSGWHECCSCSDQGQENMGKAVIQGSD